MRKTTINKILSAMEDRTYTFAELSVAAKVGLATAWRFLQCQGGKTVYIESWYTKKHGGDPTPLIRKMVYGDEESAPRPVPKTESERSKTYRARKYGVKPIKDPVLYALMKKI